MDSCHSPPQMEHQCGLQRKIPMGKKITFHKWMTCTCVVSFEITNNKRKTCLRVETMCHFWHLLFDCIYSFHQWMLLLSLDFFILFYLLLHVTLIVLFVWTDVIVHVSLSYNLFDLQRIPYVPHQYSTTKLVIIIYSMIDFMSCVVIRLVLPKVSYFVPVSYAGDVEQHDPFKVAVPGEAWVLWGR